MKSWEWPGTEAKTGTEQIGTKPSGVALSELTQRLRSMVKTIGHHSVSLQFWLLPHCTYSDRLLCYILNLLDTSSNGIYALAALGTLQPQAFGSLTSVDPLDSVSNYYFSKAATRILCKVVAMRHSPEKWVLAQDAMVASYIA